MTHATAATWMRPLLWALIYLPICSTFFSWTCSYPRLFHFFMVAIPIGHGPFSPLHSPALMHHQAIMMLRAFHIASAHSAIALADICGAYSFELAKTFTLSRTPYSLRTHMTISSASYIFFPKRIHNAMGAAHDHPSPPSTVIKSGPLPIGRSAIALTIHSTFDLSEITTLTQTGFPHAFSDAMSINSRNSFSLPAS